MRVKLHHINLATGQVAEMDRFYREVIGQVRATTDLPVLERNRGYAGEVAFVTDGRVQTHLAERDLRAGFATGQVVNPVERGHIAFRSPDLAASMARLKALGVPWSDWGERAVAGWHQIFFYDPDGRVIEIHQALDGPEPALQGAGEGPAGDAPRLHHINLSTDRVAEVAQFYRDALGLEDTEDDIPALRGDARVYDGEVAFLSDGHMHLHIARKDVLAGFRTRQLVNPVMAGHLAFRVGDLDRFKAALGARSIPSADWGDSAVAGWQQIYFHDPEGNVIEVHERTG